LSSTTFHSRLGLGRWVKLSPYPAIHSTDYSGGTSWRPGNAFYTLFSNSIPRTIDTSIGIHFGIAYSKEWFDSKNMTYSILMDMIISYNSLHWLTVNTEDSDYPVETWKHLEEHPGVLLSVAPTSGLWHHMIPLSVSKNPMRLPCGPPSGNKWHTNTWSRFLVLQSHELRPGAELVLRMEWWRILTTVSDHPTSLPALGRSPGTSASTTRRYDRTCYNEP